MRSQTGFGKPKVVWHVLGILIVLAGLLIQPTVSDPVLAAGKCDYKIKNLAPVASMQKLVATTPAATGPASLVFNKTVDMSDYVQYNVLSGLSSTLLPLLKIEFTVQSGRTLTTSQSVGINYSHPVPRGVTARMKIYFQQWKWAYDVQEVCYTPSGYVTKNYRQAGTIIENLNYFSVIECRKITGSTVTWQVCGP